MMRAKILIIGLILACALGGGINIAAGEDSKEPVWSEDKRFKDNRNGTITDAKTGLMWMKEDSYLHSGHWLNWFQAIKFVEELNRDQFAGYIDWAAPTVEELTTLFEAEKLNSSQVGSEMKIHLDPIFGKEGSGTHWSGDANGRYNAFGVVFNTGNRFNSSKKNKARKAVRAVRHLN